MHVWVSASNSSGVYSYKWNCWIKWEVCLLFWGTIILWHRFWHNFWRFSHTPWECAAHQEATPGPVTWWPHSDALLETKPSLHGVPSHQATFWRVWWWFSCSDSPLNLSGTATWWVSSMSLLGLSLKSVKDKNYTHKDKFLSCLLQFSFSCQDLEILLSFG